MSSGGNRVKTGSFVGTGADLNIDTLGFKPQRVKVINVDGDCFCEWNSEMDDDSAMKTIAAGTTAQITSDGITARTNGFTMGADTDINVDGEKCTYECVDGGQ